MELIFAESGADGAATDVQKKYFFDAAGLIFAREEIDPEVWEISITFENETGIARLNSEYRGKDSPTDVLSFPMYNGKDELLADAERMPAGATLPLGDVVICREIAKKQALECGHSEDRELVYLFVHSIFHLLGYDHMNDEEKAEMRAAEEDIMAQMGLMREE